MADRFVEGKGYFLMTTKDLISGEFTILEQGYHMGENRKRHGGVLSIEDEEYEYLLRFYDRDIRL